MKHLVIDISAHGFGHVSQTAPVLNALRKKMPALKMTVRSAAPELLLRERIDGEFHHLSCAFDFGMTMESAVQVRIEESRSRYHEFHTNWQEKIECEAAALRALSPDLLFANVPYLSLAAAQHAEVPAVALCSLNWADIYQHYCLQDATDRLILQQMQAAYNSAHCFLQPQPSMSMPAFARRKMISPIAKVSQLSKVSTKAPTEKWILVAMGGVEFRLPVENWPSIAGVRWIIPAAWQVMRADCQPIESCGLAFSDLLASCDAVITKPGYGTFAEAACNGVPLLYVSRENWPEEPFLVNWLREKGMCLEVSRQQLLCGDLAATLEALFALPRPTLPLATGANEAADYLYNILNNQ